ncbi:MAG: hypothetical protein WCF18_11965 [Chthoniobacteraceae bacterium]
MQDFTEISYVIDANDRLVSVSPGWTAFAVQNQGEELTPEAMKSRLLWDFIADETTRELYGAVLEHVRSGTPTDLILRCDAPERRRLIEMIVSLRPDGNVEFKTVLLATTTRAAQRLFAKSTPRSDRRIMVCSWCDRVNAGVEEWLEVEVAMERLHLTDEPELPQVESVVCPGCFAKVTEILAQSKAAATS